MNMDKQDFNHFFKIARRLRYPVVLIAGMFATSFVQAQVPVPERVAAATAGTPAVHPTARPVEEEEYATTTTKPSGEGIKVHGHWIIDVRDPDGTLVKHKDFQNSLVTAGAGISGDQVMLALLSGNMAMGDPGIAFVSTVSESGVLATDPTTYCYNFPAAATSGICSIFTTNTNSPLSGIWNNTQTGLTTVATFGPSVKWVLSGNWVVPSGTTSILYVQTIMGGCFSQSGFTPLLVPGGYGVSLSGSLSGRTGTTAPAACYANNPANSTDTVVGIFPFTSTLVPGEPPTGLPVTPDQVITIKVTISFS